MVCWTQFEVEQLNLHLFSCLQVGIFSRGTKSCRRYSLRLSSRSRCSSLSVKVTTILKWIETLMHMHQTRLAFRPSTSIASDPQRAAAASAAKELELSINMSDWFKRRYVCHWAAFLVFGRFWLRFFGQTASFVQASLEENVHTPSKLSAGKCSTTGSLLCKPACTLWILCSASASRWSAPATSLIGLFNSLPKTINCTVYRFHDVTVYFKLAVPTFRPQLCNATSASSVFCRNSKSRWMISAFLLCHRSCSHRFTFWSWPLKPG